MIFQGAPVNAPALTEISGCLEKFFLARHRVVAEM